MQCVLGVAANVYVHQMKAAFVDVASGCEHGPLLFCFFPHHTRKPCARKGTSCEQCSFLSRCLKVGCAADRCCMPRHFLCADQCLFNKIVHILVHIWSSFWYCWVDDSRRVTKVTMQMHADHNASWLRQRRHQLVPAAIHPGAAQKLLPMLVTLSGHHRKRRSLSRSYSVT